MMFKDKSMLGGVEYNGGSCISEGTNGRAGMLEYRLISGHTALLPDVGMGSLAWGGIPWSGALNPAAPYGMRANTMEMGFLSINPLYDQKQVAASLAFWKHVNVGIGQNINIFGFEVYKELGAFLHDFPGGDTPVFQMQYPSKHLPSLAEKYPKELIDLVNQIKTIPPTPDPLTYDVEIPWSEELKTAAMRSLWSLAFSTPDLDVEKALKDTAKIVNSILAEQHIQDAKTKFKNYFTALGEFYKKNYPEFYEKEWPTLLEKQYKVW